ncbi:MAG: serine hydrolase domain-containing protein, partial [Planctomycetota bacterium]
TVRQLLEHRSGLPADVAGAATIGRAEALRALLAAPLVFPPGERVQVSGPGYALLIALVEEVAEDTWSPYAAENLLGPARMTSSGLWGEPRWDGRRLARGHAQGQDVGTPAERVPTWADLGAGAFIAPVRDIARWQEALDSETLLDEPHRQLLRALAPDSGREPPRTPGFTTQSLSGPVLLAANGEWQGVAEAVRRLAQGSELPLPPAAPSSPADVAAAAEVRLVEGREPGELCVQILAADGTVLAENPPRDG